MDIGEGYYEISEELTGNWTNVDANPYPITIEENERKIEFINNAQNDPPIARPDTYPGTVNGVTSVGIPGVLTNDDDPDNDDIEVIGYTTPTSGVITDWNSDGSFLYTTEPGFIGDVTFDYTIMDTYGATATSTVTIHVEGQED